MTARFHHGGRRGAAAITLAGAMLMAAIGAGRGGADEAAVVRDVHGQPSWILAGDDVEVAVTKLGGHMAPVTFDRRGKPFQPYHVSPWQDEKLESFPAAALAADAADPWRPVDAGVCAELKTLKSQSPIALDYFGVTRSTPATAGPAECP